MRARAGDPPRTMPQKILAGRADDPSLSGDLVDVKVDQVVLAREPAPVLHEILNAGLKKVAVEIAVAYESRCTTGGAMKSRRDALPREVVQQNVLLARPGIGFPAAVHLERFAAPARLALTDEPRLTSLGGAGLLTVLASPSQLADVLTRGSAKLRPVRSIQILLSGKLRPFVGVRDVGLELLRQGLSEKVRHVDEVHQAPVVLEFAGQSSRLLSVPERAVLCSLAPQSGAAGAVFVSDERTEVFLRDQRRSKAHRGLAPDAGAPCDDVLTLDLGTVDPLILDTDGEIHSVRELEGQKVSQVVLGGDCTPLKELLATAALLKSKRIPPSLDFMLAPPSRQTLEVLASDGALVDLLATGARILEPDERILSGDLYPPVGDGGVSLRTFEAPAGTPREQRGLVASTETVAAAIAHGVIIDPRTFKRPVRVTVPRVLPTDDALIIRKQKGKKNPVKPAHREAACPLLRPPWNGPSELQISTNGSPPRVPTALICTTLEQVRWAVQHAGEFAPHLRAVAAAYLPAAYVSVFSGLGILALSGDQEAISRLGEAKQIQLPAIARTSQTLELVADDRNLVRLRWLAIGSERDWTIGEAIGTLAAPGT